MDEAEPVDAIMSRGIVTVTMDDTLATARDLFRRRSFHHLLVLDRGRLAGVLSDRDLLKAISPYVGTLSETTRDAATLDRRVHQIMSRHPITVTTGSSVAEAARLLVDRKISCLPVLAGDGSVAGILSWRDLLRATLPKVTVAAAPASTSRS